MAMCTSLRIASLKSTVDSPFAGFYCMHHTQVSMDALEGVTMDDGEVRVQMAR